MSLPFVTNLRIVGRKIANLKIARKLIAAFALLIVVMLGVNAVVWQNMAVIEKSVDRTTHSYAVLDEMENVMAAMLNQETALRGFLISGNERFLRPYKTGAGSYAAAFARLKELAADDPAQQTRLDELNSFVETWREQVAEKEIALMRDPLTREQARNMEASGVGRTFMDSIRRKVAEIETIERELMEERAADEARAFAWSYRITIVGGALSVLIAAGVCFLLARGIVSPITAMTSAMTGLAAGDKAAEIPAQDRKDEIGAMAAAVQVFKENAIEMDHLAAEQRALEQKAAEDKKRAMNELADRFQASIGGVVSAVASAATEMRTAAESMSATADETSRKTTAVSATSEQASSNAEAVASAAEELSASIVEIGRQVADAAGIAQKAVQEAERTNAQIEGLAEAAQTIGEVVTLIQDIANQTNLLALNATIEAARAGEAGKGFAVVASEVKTLASQTSKATEEIAAQISAMQGATDRSVDAIKKIGETIARINEIAAAIASAVEEQGAATQEIASNVQQAAQGTREVSSTIGGVTQAVSETGAAAAQMLSTANDLAEQSERLRAQVDEFLGQIRAA